MQKKTGPGSGRPNSKFTSGGNSRSEQGGTDRPYKKRDASSSDEKPYKRKPADRSIYEDRRRPSNDDASGGAGKSYKKPFKKDGEGSYAPKGERKPFDRSKSFNSEGRPPRFEKRDGDKKPFSSEGRPPRFEKRDGDRKPFNSEGRPPRFEKRDGDKKPFSSEGRPPRFEKSDGDRKPFNADGRPPRFEKRDGDSKPFKSREFKKPFNKDEQKPYSSDGERKPFEKKGPGAYSSFKKERKFDGEKKNFDNQEQFSDNKEKTDWKPKPKTEEELNENSDSKRRRVVRADEKRPFKEPNTSKPFDRKKAKPNNAKVVKPLEKRILSEDDEDDLEEELINAGVPIKKIRAAVSPTPDIMPLNKFVAHSGVCSRRDAAILVKEGKVKVNDEVILDPGHKVNITDEVVLNDKKLTPQKGLVYLLLNKPKDYITTNEDPQGRKTVMDLVQGAEAERLYPVGRLDRNTSGLLLITNDGELAQKLAHPSYKVKKIYQVTLDKPLTKADSEKIVAGVELEDGTAFVDALAYLEKKNEIGLEIHSGKNRIVRRIFESLGYVVEKLDRMMYAGLTKKNLPRGKWRYLNEREVILLKHFK